MVHGCRPIGHDSQRSKDARDSLASEVRRNLCSVIHIAFTPPATMYGCAHVPQRKWSDLGGVLEVVNLHMERPRDQDAEPDSLESSSVLVF